MKKYELKDAVDLFDYLTARDGLSFKKEETKEAKKARILLKKLIYYFLKINKYNIYIIYKFNNNNILIETAIYELTDLYDVTIEELIENKILIESEV